jgi:tryptophan 2,3-dioxygenase
MTPTYWDYLRLDQLLDLQGGLEGNEEQLMPDELHFIIVHQSYELWFKLALRSLRLARDKLARPEVPEEVIPLVVHHLRRVTEIFRLGVEQFRVMETLTPIDFLDFRDKLIPSSGFQSFQMRELEILLGLEESQREIYGTTHPLDHIKKLAEDSPGGALAWSRITQARSEQSLRDALHTWLYRTPIQGSSPDEEGDDEAVKAFVEEYLGKASDRREVQLARMIEVSAGSPQGLRDRFDAMGSNAREFLLGEDVDPKMRRVRAAALFIESYRELPLLAWPRLLVDTILEVEEELVIWRHRHARMVERLIGRRVGTGGSSGVDYLDKTAKYRVFPELWAVRAMLSPRDTLPELQNRDQYGFTTDGA